MALPAGDVELIRQLAAELAPVHDASRLRFEAEVEGAAVTLFECQAPWNPQVDADWRRVPFAQLRYSDRDAIWALYDADANGKWSRYSDVPPSADVRRLIEGIRTDTTGVFLG